MARKCCGNPNLEEDGGVTVCTNCGSVISESQIVAEIQFGETSAGAAVVQGSFLGATDTHARNTGPFNRKGGGESREVTLAAGRRKIQQLAAALSIPETYTDVAARWFTLALTNGFTHGRRTQNVVACCLYAVCRQEKSSHMLIDFSDILHINVFTLGQTYLKLVRVLCIPVTTIDPSIYIHRFAKHLEFGKDTMKVAADANRLVSRMNRDWIVQGRRPSGICGACLLIAARMNNYRRSVRELVYVVKVADLTIHKRLEEFKKTKSSSLTVDEFRNMWLEQAHDPPSFGAQNKKRKRRVREVNENGEVIHENPNAQPSQQTGEATQTATEIRRDADGFVIPPVPIDPALLEHDLSQTSPPQAAPSSVGTTEANSPPTYDSESTSTLAQPTIDDVFDKVADEVIESEITNIVNATETDAVVAELAEVRRLQREKSAQSTVSDDPDDLADVDDDWEVQGALLTEEETAIKEQIWTELNKEYLLEQEAKRLKAERDARNGITKNVRKRRKTGPRNKPRDSTSANQAASPAESAKEMLAKRTYSKKINYAALDHLFDND